MGVCHLKQAVIKREVVGALELHRRASHSGDLYRKGGRLVRMKRAACRLRMTGPGSEGAASGATGAQRLNFRGTASIQPDGVAYVG